MMHFKKFVCLFVFCCLVLEDIHLGGGTIWVVQLFPLLL
jgi:hypothetical protein